MTLLNHLTPPRGTGPTGHQWYKIKNKADDDDGPTQVWIYDVIGDSWWGGVSAQNFVKELSDLDADEAIEFHINSPGGDVYDGIAIMNAIRRHRGPTTSVVDGLAASAASFIALGADEVVMADNSEMMIHDASARAIGNAADMREAAERLDKVSDNIARVYAGKAGGELAEWRDLMRAETWYSAQEARDAGLADRVIEAKPDDVTKNKAAHAPFMAQAFRHPGRANAPAPMSPAASAVGSTHTKQEGSAPVFTDEQLTTMRQQLGLPEDADAATILSAQAEALAERADDGQPQNAAPTLPAGVVAVEASVLDQLRNDAAAGRAAREQQITDLRASLVDGAIADGRIAPARRQHWLDALAADHEGASATLASLAPGLIPVDGPRGHSKTTEADEVAQGDLGWFDTVTPASKEG